MRRGWGATAAALVLVAGAVVVRTPSAGAVTDPNPTTFSIEGDSAHQFTVQQMENDAFNANGLGTLSPTFTAVTSGESAARADLAAGQTDVAAVSEPLTTSDLTTAQHNGITPGYVAYGQSAVSIIVGISTGAGVPPVTSLNLTMPTLAKIFTHQIQSWGASEITAENPSEAASLQDPLFKTPIQVVERRTSSPTTAALIAAFLADPLARPIWNVYASEFGSPTDTPLDIWPDDVLSSANGVTAGEEGEVSTVLDLMASGPTGPQNAIGYVTPQWAEKNNAITVGILPTGATTPVSPDAAGVQAAFASPGVTFDATTDLYTVDYTKITNPAAYPIPLPVYYAVPVKGGDPAKMAATLGFLKFALSAAGQADDTATGVIANPAAVATAAQAVVASFGATTMTGSMSTTSSTTVAPNTTASTSFSAGSSSGSTSSGDASDDSSTGLPATGGTLPIRAAAVGITMAIVGEVVRRRSRRSRRQRLSR